LPRPVACVKKKKGMNMEYQMNDTDWEKQNIPAEKCIPVPLCPPEIPHGLD